MAESFAVAPLADSVNTPADVGSQINPGVAGGGMGRAVQASGIQIIGERSGASTLDSLIKIGDSFLRPKVEAARQQQMGEGAIAALQGATAAQLSEGDVFGGFFGDATPVAAGRAVEATNKLTDAMTAVTTSMQEWQKLPPEQFRQELPKLFDKHKTGDPATDAILSQNFMKQLPGITELHTKASIRYKNEQTALVFHNSIIAEGSAIHALAQARAKHPTDISEAQVEAATGKMLQTVSSYLQHATPEQATKTVFSALKEFGAAGNLKAMEALDKSGLTSLLKPEDQARVPELIEKTYWKNVATNPDWALTHGSIGNIEFQANKGTISDYGKLKEFAYSNGAMKNPGAWYSDMVRNNEMAKERNRQKLIADAKEASKERQEMLALQYGMGVMATTHDASQPVYGMSEDKKMESLNRLYAEGTLTVDAIMAKNGKLPTAPLVIAVPGKGKVMQEAPATTYYNLLGRLRNGRLADRDLSLLADVGRWEATNPQALLTNFGQDGTNLLRDVLQAGVLSETDPDKRMQRLSQVTDAIRQRVESPVAAKERTAAIRSSITPNLVAGALNSPGLTGVNAQVVGLTQTQLGRLLPIVQRRVELTSTGTLQDITTVANDAVASIVREHDFVGGVAVTGGNGQPKQFQAATVAVLGVKDGYGSMAPELMAQATTRALEAKLLLDEKRAGNQSDAYEVLSATHTRDNNGRPQIAVHVKFPKSSWFGQESASTNAILLSPEEVAEWIKKPEHMRKKAPDPVTAFDLAQ